MSMPARPGPPLRIVAPQVAPSVRTFLSTEAGSGAVLLVATVAALVWANSPWWTEYFAFWHTPVVLRFGGAELRLDLQHLVNDGAMALFFLVVGLEISREVTWGELRDRRTVLVPVFGAIGGLILPALIYLLINHGNAAAHAWGIVISTDTAFLLGLLALFGPRCPNQLRLFLLTLAIVDDVGAISVIAVAYTRHLRVSALIAAVVLLAVIVLLRWLGVWRLSPYALIGVALWFAVYLSGVHPTLAGVLLGLLVPARPSRPEQIARLPIFGRALAEEQSASRARLAALAASASVSANERMQLALHHWSAYLIVPVFGLANAGVHLTSGVLQASATSPVTIGIVVALVVGNAVGITAAATIALRTGLGTLPGMVRYGHLAAGAILAGIGFTIALFIADLALAGTELHDEAKIGILFGSLLAAVLGATTLRVLGNRFPLCSPGESAPAQLPPLPWRAPEKVG